MRRAAHGRTAVLVAVAVATAALLTAHVSSAFALPKTTGTVTSGLVLVRAKPSAVPSAMALRHRVPARSMAKARYETVAVKPPAGTSDEQLAAELMVDPNVEAASLDYARYPVAYTSNPNDPYANDASTWIQGSQVYPYARSWWYRASGSDWGTKAARVWPNLEQDGAEYHARAGGDAFKVAVLDTGFYMDHPDKGSGIVVGKDMCETISTATGLNVTTDFDVTPVPTSAPVPSGWTARDAFDAGHGTCVAGQIAAASDNATGVASVGFDNHVAVYKVEGVWIEGDTGWGYPPGAAIMFDSVIIDAIDQAVLDGCKVVSMSLGGPDYNSAMQAAINDAYANDVLVVAASGNDSTSTVLYPAANSHVVGVGSYSLSGGGSVTGVARTGFTNWGTGLDILAPGVVINGMITPGFDADDSNSICTPGYASWQGTSMATPVVAGSAAMLWRFVPDMTPDEIADVLFQSSRDMGPAGYETGYGWGAMDVEAAYNRIKSLYPALSGASPTGASLTNQTTYPVSWTAVAGADHYEVSVDGGSPVTRFTTSTTVALAGDGVHTVSVRPISTGRRWSGPVQSVSVTLDTVAPVVSGVSYDEATNRVSFTGEPGATTQGRVDAGAPVAITSNPWQLGAQAEGDHTAEVRQIDPAGNVGSWAGVNFTIAPAATPPGAPVIGSPTSGVTVNTSTVDVGWDSVPTATGYEYALNDGTPVATSALSVKVTGLSVGSNQIKVRAFNGAGASAWSVPVTVTYTPPANSTTTISGPASVARAATVALTGRLTAGGLGVPGVPVAIERRVGTGAWTRVGNATTGATGYWSYSATEAVTSEFRAVFDGSAQVGASSSAAVVVGQRVALSKPALSTTRPVHGRTYTGSVYLTPRHPAGKNYVTLRLERKEGTRWVLRRTLSSKTYGAGASSLCKSSVVFPYAGSWRVQATYPATTSYAYTTSARYYVNVR